MNKKQLSKTIRSRRFSTPRGRLKYLYFRPENIISFINKYSLDSIFNKHNVTKDRRHKICRLLMGTQVERNIELKAISKKSSYRLSEKINLPKLYKDVQILLDITPCIKKEEKERIKNIINFAIILENGRRESLKEIEKSTLKRTLKKIKKNERNLQVYTLLIKELIRLLNPIFRDSLLLRTRLEEKTFKLASEIINRTFPSIKLTPQQIKGRFHK